MALWARRKGPIKNVTAQGNIACKIQVEILRFLCGPRGWQYGEVIRASRGNKVPEGQT